MSANHNAANIAALAAFNAGKKKESNGNAATTAPRSTDSNQNKVKTHSQPQSQPRRSPSTQRPATIIKKQKSTSVDAPLPPSLQPAYAPTQSPQARDPLSDYEEKGNVDSISHDYFVQTPRQVSRQGSIKSPHYSPMPSPSSPRDMISNVKNSIDSKAINNDASAKRLSLDYSPQEMLKNLKESLNRKSQVQTNPKVMDARGKTILEGVRERFDDNMKETSNNLANLSLKHYQWSKSHSDADVRENRGINDSQSSFETCMTDVDPRRSLRCQSTPDNGHGVRIDVTDHDAEMERKQDEDVNDATVKVPPPIPESDRLSVTDIPSQSPVTNKGVRRKPPPPASSDEESESIARRTTSDTDTYTDDLYFNSSDGFSGDELRKQMQMNGMSMDTFSSGEAMFPPDDDLGSFIEKEDSDPVREIKVKDTKFPQFPDVRKHHQHLFGMRRHKLKEGDKYHRYDTGANSDDDEVPVSQISLTQAPPLPQQQVQNQGHSSTSKSNQSQSQPVQFKSTMRKENKRKDRKTKFDELKPWKTHQELNFPTDQERKRYEGVWVSNKGLYMDLVVTKLTGVDGSKLTEQHDDSMKAALISTNALPPDEVKDDTADHKRDDGEELQLSKAEEAASKLHSLQNTDSNQLILGAVVKRIWNRSRLPNDILEQIWNLVDFRRDGTLNKNEFLVGMWLVDQCLYGRKLPKKIEPIVWDSLGGIGVQVNLNSRRWK